MKTGSDLSAHRPLDDIRVLAIEQIMSGPYGSMLLADMGAEVIKIERPGRGDPSRNMGPFFKNEEGEVNTGSFLRLNRNKKSLTLDLKNERGKEIFKEYDEKFEHYGFPEFDKLTVEELYNLIMKS